MRLCNVCPRVATIRDTEYGEDYCQKHAESFQVFDGPWEPITVETA